MPLAATGLSQKIERTILSIRGERVMLVSTLAALYEVETKALNRAVRRNVARFPPDFMFVLTLSEYRSLRRQSGTLERGRGKHRKYLPMAFSEQGIAMLSSVLRSARAVAVNIEIVRTFVRLRRFLATHRELARRLDSLERRHEAKFEAVFEAIHRLMTPPDPPRRRIGFDTSGDRP